MNPSRIRTLLLVTALALVASATGTDPRSARAADDGPAAAATRVWVELPRSGTDARATLDDLPYAPEPNARALDRRARKGRPDRVAVLSRGPDAEALRALLASGVRVRFVSRWLSMASVDADAEGVARLRATFGERAVRPVRTLVDVRSLAAHGLPEPNSLGRVTSPYDYGPSLLQNTQIQADRLHALGFTGRGVRVLVLDSGYRLDHPAFTQLDVVAEWDFVFGDANTANEIVDTATQDRHGTGVLGVLAGLHEGKLVGVAPAVEVLLAKTEYLPTETRVEEDWFVQALEWGEALGAEVATASLGYLVFADEPDAFAYAPSDLDGDTAVTTRAVDDLVALGVVAVNSAGNNGPAPSSLNTPADADSVIAVGAVDSLGVVRSFSSRGPTADGRIKPEVAARGHLTVWAETATGDDYTAVSGTSLSAPLVAGAAALVLEAHPEWGPGAVRDALMQTATQSGAPDNDLGWGIVQAHDAVFALEAPQWPLPVRLLSPGPGDSVLASANTFVWTRALDLQTPAGVQYQLQFSSTPEFTLPAAIYEAGADTTLGVDGLGTGDWWWRVRAVDPDGHARLSEVRAVRIEASTAAPAAYASRWLAPWPNPTDGTSHLRLRLRSSSQARVDVHDLAGRRVRTLVSGVTWPQGERLLQWDGTDEAGRPVSSGVYFVRAALRSPDGGIQEMSTRVVLMR